MAKFKTGDKVRLVGTGWGEYDNQVHTITSYHQNEHGPDRVALEGVFMGQQFGIIDNWEIEPVGEWANVSSDELVDLREGDRVRVTHDGQVVESIITSAYSYVAYVRALSIIVWEHDIENGNWTLEVFREEPERVLPTEPGWYLAAFDENTVRDFSFAVKLSEDGTWLCEGKKFPHDSLLLDGNWPLRRMTVEDE